MIHRRQTRSVRVGNVVIGSSAPIVIQSMTTTTPLDLDASLRQIERLMQAGCEMIRIAVPSLPAAAALAGLRRAMDERGWMVPLIADVHFSPRAALEAASHVAKVRINPGNFARDRAEARRHLAPLIARLRERGAALRIGVNHGSLSRAIAAQFGQGPEGMAASALEYLELCRELDFLDIVVSLKASNPVLMSAANRLLVARMDAEGFDQPIHLGVTEAGAGRVAELRSAAGIGSLLLDGIGDTIRVSLTGDPVAEIEICRSILKAADHAGEPGYRPAGVACGTASDASAGSGAIPRRERGVPLVELAVTLDHDPASLDSLLSAAAAATRNPNTPAESLLIVEAQPFRPHDARAVLSALQRLRFDSKAATPIWLASGEDDNTWDDLATGPRSERSWFVALRGLVNGLSLCLSPSLLRARDALGPDEWSRRLGEILRDLRSDLTADSPVRLRWHVFVPHVDLRILPELAAELLAAAERAGFVEPEISFAGRPLLCSGRLLAGMRSHSHTAPRLQAMLPDESWEAAVAAGTLLLDGLIDGITVRPAQSSASIAESICIALDEAFTLLQATRRRFFQAEFISCPGCGRLSFDLESAVRRLQARFSHLRDVKIAVMGCAVNGPGEMADADFGYVGSVGNRVDLYVGRHRVRRGLRPEEAEEALVALLREHGRWREPG